MPTFYVLKHCIFVVIFVCFYVTFRRREAKLLGHSSYADYAMQTKMAGSVDNILDMLDHLLHKGEQEKKAIDLNALYWL